jgi:hypothetical protein
VTDALKQVERAEHNERLYVYLREQGATYNDWQVTVLFYAALHYLRAYAAYNHLPMPKSHEGSWAVISKEAFLKREIASEYAELQNRSEDARCKLIRLPPAENLYNIEFQRIKQRIRKAIGL